jgi:hypothetical protein
MIVDIESSKAVPVGTDQDVVLDTGIIGTRNYGLKNIVSLPGFGIVVKP